MFPRRTFAHFAAALLGLAAVLGAGQAQDIRFFRIGTGTTGGTYFPVGGLIASAISNPPGGLPCGQGGSCGIPGLIAVAQATAGSRANVEGLRAGTLDSGFVQADVAYWAFRGEGPFEGEEPFTGMRALASLYPEAVHVVVRADSGLEQVADLEGKRVAVGEKGSGTLIDARAILDTVGVQEDEIESVYVGPGPAADMLVAEEIDAFFITGGVPLEAVADLARRMDIRLLPLGETLTVEVRDELPFFTTTSIPEGAYEGVAATPTLAVSALWVTTDDLDAELAYGLTEALWAEPTQHLLAGGHPRAAAIRPEDALRGLSIPLHEAAARYYREHSLLPRDRER